MKKRIKVASILAIATTSLLLFSCDGSYGDSTSTKKLANELQTNQPTPTDITYSLQRYNLIRRAYWINGMYDTSKSLHCDVEKTTGYIYLYSGNSKIAEYVVDGQITSLRAYLTPDSDAYSSQYTSYWLADVDGTYGDNPDGIFFFTKDGNYVEWCGNYLYSSQPLPQTEN